MSDSIFVVSAGVSPEVVDADISTTVLLLISIRGELSTLDLHNEI
jgi:hypothetical protein